MLAHDLPSQRKSWAPHASEGFYLGPALNHYRCYRIWNVRTQSERVSETVFWLPHNNISVPTPTPDDLLLASVQDLHNIIRKSTPQQLPHLTSTGHRLLLHLKKIFACPPPRVEPSSPLPVGPFPPPRVEPSPPPRERLSPPRTPFTARLFTPTPLPLPQLSPPFLDLPPIPSGLFQSFH